MELVTLIYIFILFIFLLIAGAIVFHMLYYRINRQVTFIMFLIFITGSLILTVFNVTYFRNIDWYLIFSNLGF